MLAEEQEVKARWYSSDDDDIASHDLPATVSFSPEESLIAGARIRASSVKKEAREANTEMARARQRSSLGKPLGWRLEMRLL